MIATCRTLFLVRSLGWGGAEHQLVLTALGLAARGHPISVVTLYDVEGYGTRLRGSDVRVRSAQRKGRWDAGAFARLAHVLREEDPTIVYSFMPAANILSSAALPMVGLSSRLIWGVRASSMDLSLYGWASRVSATLEARLSAIPDAIVSNSRAGARDVIARGFPERKLRVIPNGIDTTRFRPDPRARAIFRNQLDIEPSDVLVGLVGRADPIKGHEVFVRAVARALQTESRLRFVAIGGDSSESAARVLAGALGVDDDIVWLGRRSDMERVYPGLDVLTSASLSEGFSNVIGEAMASGVPCVVSDVGDSAWIVGSTGRVVPPADPTALARAWAHMADLGVRGRGRLGDEASERISTRFGVESMLDAVEGLLYAEGPSGRVG